VETGKFKEYLQRVKPQEDVSDHISSSLLTCNRLQPGTCAHLQAVHMQNIVKFKNAVISGIVGVQCQCKGKKATYLAEPGMLAISQQGAGEPEKAVSGSLTTPSHNTQPAVGETGKTTSAPSNDKAEVSGGKVRGKSKERGSKF